jgi:hypothetical protein
MDRASLHHRLRCFRVAAALGLPVGYVLAWPIDHIDAAIALLLRGGR